MRAGSVKGALGVDRVASAGQGSGWGGGVELVEELVCAPAAGELQVAHVPAVLGDQGVDARAHGAPVAEDVFDEGPGDAVVDAVGVLAASVAPSPLGDGPEAGPGR